MYDSENDIEIDEYTYLVIADVLRKMHGLKRNDKIPANESTKMILIEDDREDYERNKTREYHSQMKNMVSAMINCEGFKYNHSEVWDMKISAFMDSVKKNLQNQKMLLYYCRVGIPALE